MKVWQSIRSYAGRPVSVADLMALATVESEDPHSLLTSLYGWKYEHISTAAKALAGGGSAVLVATVLPLIQIDPKASIDWGWMTSSWIAACLLIAIGVGLFGLARRVHAEYVAAHALLAELVEVSSFIKLYQLQVEQL